MRIILAQIMAMPQRPSVERTIPQLDVVYKCALRALWTYLFRPRKGFQPFLPRFDFWKNSLNWCSPLPV